MNGVSRDFSSQRKVATLLTLRSTKIQKTMNPQKFQEQILNNAVQMDASVNFQLNGNMLIVPCPWEDDKQVTNGERVCYRGGIEVDADGRTRVKRYKEGSKGPLHETLYETAHGAVKMTRPIYRKSGRKAGLRCINDEFVYVTFKFPKKLGLALTKALYQEEADEIMSFFKTRKEETVWK